MRSVHLVVYWIAAGSDAGLRRQLLKTAVPVLAAVALPAYSAARAASSKAVGAHSLHVLAVAGQLYLNDHDQQFWPYSQFPSNGGTMWWFGWESNASRFGTAEGQRTVDYSQGPLGPYAIAAGGVKTDPALAAYRPQLKPKYKDGNYGYGYNTLLPGGNATRFSRPGEIVMFATSAQVNTFQAPASASHPMVEEFYEVNDMQTTVHFRDGGRAMVVCLDGNLRELPMDPTTLDTRMPAANIGSFARVGSKKYLAYDAP